MPAVPPHIIVNALLNALQQSGGVGYYTSTAERTHPRKFLINYQDTTFSLWVYIWTLTHGGRTTLPDEYRIQMTSVSSPLPLNPDGYTVLLGYYHDLDMFAGFDLSRHRTFTEGSPSVQIDISVINAGLQNGLAFGTKDNKEIAVAVRPDQFIHYIVNADALHSYGADSKTLGLLIKASESTEIKIADIKKLASNRQKIVAEISKYSRSANFRKRVLDAYEHRCAVTRAQLKLVEAAHILPVPSKLGSDHTTNGIALSPTMHRAYDNCLIYLDNKLVMRLNNQKVSELTNLNLQAGLSQLRSFLNKRIHLPSDKSLWPKTDYIKEANKYRRIPGYS